MAIFLLLGLQISLKYHSRTVDESGDVVPPRSQGIEQLLQHPGILHGIVSVVALSQEVSDHGLLGVTGQTTVDVLAQQEGIQKAGHQPLELTQERELPQHSSDHRRIEAPRTVGRQHQGSAEGAKEVDEGGEDVG